MLTFDIKFLPKIAVLGMIAIISLCHSAYAGTLVMDADNGARMTITYTGFVTGGNPTGTADQGIFSGVLTDTSFNPGLINIPLDLYCVDLNTQILYSTTYNATATNDGMIGSLPPFPGLVNNADQVASLLTQYAAAATTDDLRMGLQAAIWQVEYGTDFALTPVGGTSLTTAGTYLAYTTDLSTVTSGNIASAIWISPTDQDFGDPVQGFAAITDFAAVPEPSAMLLMAIGLPFFAALVRRRRKI